MRFETGENEAGRRLDRVLKKIFRNLPLSFIYKTIRKDVKVNGKRVSGETLLKAGDVVEIFLSDKQMEEYSRIPSEIPTKRKQFGIIFEDENVLVADKPYGLLTHGDTVEKKNTLANQVASYLAETGAWVPGGMRTFTPAPANRLDRNTTGIVLFGKTLPAARDFAQMLRGGEDGNMYVEKAYLTVVKGEMKAPLLLKAQMVRDSEKNITKVLSKNSDRGLAMATEVRPLAAGRGFTLVEASLLTGRTHQIRVQLADAGFPVIGDRKYGCAETNRMVAREYGLTSQLLHAYRLTVKNGLGSLEYLKGTTFRAKLPGRFTEIMEDLGCVTKTKL